MPSTLSISKPQKWDFVRFALFESNSQFLVSILSNSAFFLSLEPSFEPGRQLAQEGACFAIFMTQVQVKARLIGRSFSTRVCFLLSLYISCSLGQSEKLAQSSKATVMTKKLSLFSEEELVFSLFSLIPGLGKIVQWQHNRLECRRPQKFLVQSLAPPYAREQ